MSRLPMTPDASQRRSTLSSALRPWFKVLARRRRRLWLGALLMFATLLSALGLLSVSGWFITATGATGLLIAAGIAANLDVYVPGGAIRFFAVSRTVSRYLERVYNHDTVLRLLSDMRTRLFGVLAELDTRTLAKRRASDWLNRLTADIDTMDSLYLRLLAPAGVGLLAIILLAGAVTWFVPSAGITLASGLLLGWTWLTLGQARLGMVESEHHVYRLEALRSRAIEQLQGLAELEAYGGLANHRQRLDQCEQALQDGQRRLGQLTALGNALEAALVSLMALVTLWLASQAFEAERISAPVMVMLPMAVLAINEALAVLPTAFTWLGATRGSADRLNQLAAQRSDIPVPAAHASAPETATPVTLHRLGVRYPHSVQPALAPLTVTFNAAERWAVEGVSGAGKSTLAALLSRQLPPDYGEMTLGGKPLADWPEQALRQRVAVMTQQSELIDDSLAANLRLAAPDADDDALWEVLDKVLLADWAKQLPHQLKTRVGEGGRQVSGGQARRIALARVLLRDPDVVLLDEPFSGIDELTAQYLSKNLDRWLGKRCVIYFIHAASHQAVTPPGITHTLKLHDPG